MDKQFFMDRLTPQQRLQIVQLYYENQRSVRNVFRALRPTCGAHYRPSETTIAYTIRKFESSYTLLDDKRPHRAHPSRSEDNIATVAESVADEPSLSIRRRAQLLGLPYATVWRILHKDLCIGANAKTDDGEVKHPVEDLSIEPVNLSIVRPKNKIKLVAASNGTGPPKKRGRPSTSSKAAFKLTIKPRGRPKSTKNTDSEDEDIEDAYAKDDANEDDERES